MEQLATRFKQSSQLSQHALTKLGLLEAMVPTYFRLVRTHTLQEPIKKWHYNNVILQLQHYTISLSTDPNSTPAVWAVHLWSSRDDSACSCSQRTVCAAVCATGSAVCGSASSSAAVQSVRDSPVWPEHRTGLHRPQHPPAMLAALPLAPRHWAAPGWMAGEENRNCVMHVMYSNV